MHVRQPRRESLHSPRVTLSALALIAISTALFVAPSATARQAAFLGKICALVKSGALEAADISGTCAQLPTRTGGLGTAWTANWGKQVRVGGADHVLGVTVIKYTPQAFGRAWPAAARTAKITTPKLREIDQTLEYNSVTGPPKKGWQGILSAVTKNGYGVTVTLFDRPATESEVKAGMIVVTGQIMKVILALK
jgi:hypothetical protein